MPLPRLSFSWKPTISGRETWRWGLFMVVPSKSGRRSKLRIMVRGLLVWLGALALLAYLAAATALYAWLDRRPHNLVTWTDCVLAPVRWDTIQRKRGDSYIASGLAAMDQMNWSEAVLKLQAGLAKSPEHRRGRERLAYFFLAAGQRERGLELLVEGMERGFPGREAMETFLRLCVAGEDFDTALRGLDLCLARNEAAVERERPWLIDQKVRVLMIADRSDAALAWIGQQTAMTDLLHESRVVALMNGQRYDEARAALAAWSQGSGAVNGGTLRLGVRLAREQGNLAEMRELLQRMRERAPMDPTPWIYGVIQETMAGETAAAQEMLDTFCMRFETRPGLLLRLAQPLVEIQAWELFERIAQRARLLGQANEDWQRLNLEAAVSRGDFAGALAVLQEVGAPAAAAEADRARAFWFELQSALVRNLASGEASAGEELLQAVRRAPVALPVLKSMATVHRKAGDAATALHLLEVARLRFPGSAAVRDQVEELRREVDAAERIVVDVPLVQDGRPMDLADAELMPAEAEPTANTRLLGSARLFLERCDALIAGAAWGDLENLLRDLRRARPAWLGGSANELLLREIELAVGLRNWPALVTHVRFRLDGTLPRALEVMNLVRRLDAAGERSAAERVLEEVERKHADFPPARRQREDWVKAAAAQAGPDDPVPGG